MLTSNSYLLSKCSYLSSRQFNHILSYNSNSNCFSFFSLFHLNNCTLKKHSTLTTSFSAIGLSETWLDTSQRPGLTPPPMIYITTGTGGGVSLYLSDCHEFNESVFVEILQPKNEKNIILGCLYKPLNVSTEIFTAEKSHNNGTVSMKDSNGNTINNP